MACPLIGTFLPSNFIVFILILLGISIRIHADEDVPLAKFLWFESIDLKFTNVFYIFSYIS